MYCFLILVKITFQRRYKWYLWETENSTTITTIQPETTEADENDIHQTETTLEDDNDTDTIDTNFEDKNDSNPTQTTIIDEYDMKDRNFWRG